MKKISLILFPIIVLAGLLLSNFPGSVQAVGQNCFSCPSGYVYQQTKEAKGWTCCSSNRDWGCANVKQGTGQCASDETCNQTTGKCALGTPTSDFYTAQSSINFQDIMNRAMPDFKFKDNATIGGIVSALLPFLFVFAGLLLLIYLIIGGFGLMTSGGDPKAMDAAKSKITSAVIGFIVIFVSYWLIQVLQIVFGLPKIF